MFDFWTTNDREQIISKALWLPIGFDVNFTPSIITLKIPLMGQKMTLTLHFAQINIRIYDYYREWYKEG